MTQQVFNRCQGPVFPQDRGMIRETHHVADFQYLLNRVFGEFVGLLVDDGKKYQECFYPLPAPNQSR
jgi:hypothetical protein